MAFRARNVFADKKKSRTRKELVIYCGLYKEATVVRCDSRFHNFLLLNRTSRGDGFNFLWNTPSLSAPEFWMTRWAPRSPTQPHDAPVPRKNLEHILLSPGYPKFPQDSPSFPHESPGLLWLLPDFPYDSSLIFTFPDFPKVSPDKRLFLKFWNVTLSLHLICY